MTAPSEVERRDVEFGAGVALVQRLTPDGIRRLQFTRSAIGRRGYNEADVEHFRARVVHEIGQANAEKAAMRQELQRQRDEVQRLRDFFRRNRVDVDAPGGHVPPPPPTQINVNIASVQAVNVMSQAQQAADQHIAQAEDYARRLVANARLQYEDILRRAHEQAQEAAVEAGRLYEASTKTSEPDRERPQEQGAQEQNSQEMQYLQSRLAYMRTFAQVTQVQLRSILDALRQELDQLTDLPNGPDAPATAAGPAAVPGGAARRELPQRR
jgi:DivIVA domain-containing protein